MALGFTDLPPELRLTVYRYLLVEDPESTTSYCNPLRFPVYQLSSQFLRTCRVVFNEGRPILYRENTISFYPVGIRRFVARIGKENVQLVQHIRIMLIDPLGMRELETDIKKLAELSGLRNISFSLNLDRHSGRCQGVAGDLLDIQRGMVNCMAIVPRAEVR